MKNKKGFTLIELMIVMAIVAILLTMVGPLAINSLEKAEARQEMLMMKNWLRKISYRAYSTGQRYILRLSGKKAELFTSLSLDQLGGMSTDSSEMKDIGKLILIKEFNSLFFQPQLIRYNTKGFVETKNLVGMYRNKSFNVNLSQWVNSENLYIDEL